VGQIFDLFKSGFTFAEELKKAQTGIKELGQQVRGLTNTRLYYELQFLKTSFETA
jgi:hypothetical protein